MRFLRKSMIGVFLATVSLGLLVYAAQIFGGALQDRADREQPDAPPQERIYAVNLVEAVAGRETPVLQSFGEIAARRSVELRAAVSGRVIALAPQFEDGGAVTRGMVLLQVDPADMQAALDRATTDLADAQAEVRDADRGLDLAQQEKDAAREQVRLREKAFVRQTDLAGRGVGTAAVVEEAEIAVASARANLLARRQALASAEARVDQSATQLARAEIALAEAKRDVDDTSVLAPFDGILDETSAIEGGLVTANERLAELIDPRELDVAFRVSTEQYVRLLDAAGTLLPAVVHVTLDAQSSSLTATGTLSRVDATAGEGQSGRLLFARLETPIGFQSGDFVTVTVEEPPLNDVVRLPASALGSDGKVLVLTDANRLEDLSVDLVRRQGNDILVRGDGLDGQEVVRQRTPLLGSGFAVRPLRPEPSDASVPADQLEGALQDRSRQVAGGEGGSEG